MKLAVLFSVLISLVLLPLPLYAEDPAVTGDLDNKLSLFESKLQRLEKSQAQVIEKDKQTEDELAGLRIVLHKKGRKKIA